MKKSILIKVFLAASLAAGAFAASASDGGFVYRYRLGVSAGPGGEDPDTQRKDILANYVAGVGMDFEEILPMKPEWTQDNWKITGGSPPAGIKWDPQTLTFRGKPTDAILGKKVALTGYDDLGRKVATAEATFDVYELPENTVKVDLYAHTDHYFSHRLAIPAGVAVEGDPVLLTKAPAGIGYNARYIQGTPTKAGTSPILAMGYDYLGKPVVAFIGKLVVADGPEFAFIQDDIKPILGIPSYENDFLLGYAGWKGAALPGIKRAIKDASKVRYYAEIDDKRPLPGTVRVTGDAYGRFLNGRTANYYDQGSMRLKAVDVDGTTGYSNWFKVGSGGAAFMCSPYGASAIGLYGHVNQPFGDYFIPSGQDTQKRHYSVSSGTLPEGLQLDTDTGRIHGTPVSKTPATDVIVQITFPDNAFSEPVVCGPYDFTFQSGDFGVAFSDYDREFRVGGSVSFTATATGMLHEGSSLEFVAETSELPPGYSYDAATRTVSGPAITAPGFYHADFAIDNGDGVTRTASASFTVRGDLTINGVQGEPEVARFETYDAVAEVTYDSETVLPQGTEKITLEGHLPAGLVFDPAALAIKGGTQDPEGDYGPLRFRITDGSGSSVLSAPFSVKVRPRLPLQLQTASAVFDQGLPGAANPAVVKQAPLAAGIFSVTYSIDPIELPEGLEFDPDTGTIKGTPLVQGSFGPYTITARETVASAARMSVTNVSAALASEPALSATTTPFMIEVGPTPPIPSTDLATLEANLPSADPSHPLPVAVTSEAPAPWLAYISDKLVGGSESVTFKSALPAVAGLDFDAATGTLSGTATEAFEGDVTISYTDGAVPPRTGTIRLPVRVLPYPEIAASSATLELPRLSGAAATGFSVSPANDGFVGSISYSLAPESNALPIGVTLVVKDGVASLAGSTKDAVGSEYEVIVRGTSTVNGLYNDARFTIRIGEPVPMTLDLSDERLEATMSETLDKVISQDQFLRTPRPSGSFIEPLKSVLADAPAWMTLSADGIIGGKPPALGDYPARIVFTDAENRTASDTFTLRATLGGVVKISPAFPEKTVRIGEFFAIPGMGRQHTISNAVLPLQGVTLSGGIPGITFDAAGAVIRGRLDTSGIHAMRVSVADAHGRGLATGTGDLSVTVLEALKQADPLSISSGAQYTTPLRVMFPAAENAISTVRHSIDGDLPGTLYYKGMSAEGTVFTRADNGDKVTMRKDEQMADVLLRLAPDALVFDPIVMSLTGYPSKAGQFSFVLKAKDDHEINGYTEPGASEGREERNRAQSKPVTLDVEARQPFSLVSSRTQPSRMIVNETDGHMVVSAVNTTYGRPATDWKVTGASALPPGITYIVGPKGVTFDGKATKIGDFGPVTVSAKDSSGTASIELRFKVVVSEDPIILNVSDIRTKVGFPVAMTQPLSSAKLSTDNTYGKLRFYSNDLSSMSALSIVMDDGSIRGAPQQPQRIDFNLFVTDETDRVTSKPVRIDVLPPVRVIVPVQIDAAQGEGLVVPSSTDYLVGTANYAKGRGAWPAGFVVDPATGVIRSSYIDPDTKAEDTRVIAKVGTYSGLTITVTDSVTVAGRTYSETKESNAFSIKVEPSSDMPDIIDPAGLKVLLGEVGKPIVPWRATTVAERDRSPWNYDGTVYSINRDVSPYGLVFDKSRGTISGTPTAPFAFTEAVITVTSASGDDDRTSPFTIGAAPADDMALSASQSTSISVRQGSQLPDRRLVWDNAVGAIRHVPWWTASTFTVTPEGVLTNTATESAAGEYSLMVTAYDAFDRSATETFAISVKEKLGLARKVPSIAPGQVLDNLEIVSGKGIYGKGEWKITGLPSFLTFDPATGKISGTVPATAAPGTTYDVTYSLIDASDGASTTGTIPLEIAAQGKTMWRIQFLPYSYQAAINDIELHYKKDGVETDAIHDRELLKSSNSPDITDDVTWQGNQFQSWVLVDLEFYQPVDARSLVIQQYTASGSRLAVAQVNIWSSNDNGATWKLEHDGSTKDPLPITSPVAVEW